MKIKKEYPKEYTPDNPYPVLKTVSREEWGAVPPSGKIEAMAWPVPYVLWTFSNSDPCYTKEHCIKAMQDLQKRHMQVKGMPDIQYNFYIGGDLNIYEGRGWKNYTTSLYPGFTGIEKMHCGIAYIGKYENQNYPNQEVLELRKELVNYGKEHKHIDWEYCNLLVTTNLSN